MITLLSRYASMPPEVLLVKDPNIDEILIIAERDHPIGESWFESAATLSSGRKA